VPKLRASRFGAREPRATRAGHHDHGPFARVSRSSSLAGVAPSRLGLGSVLFRRLRSNATLVQMPWTVREALPADAAAIAVTHIRAWRAAYRGVFPDAFLDGIDETARMREDEREKAWRDNLEQPKPAVRTLVVCDGASHTLVGFATVGPDRDNLGIGELYAINLHPDAWGKGAGRALLDASVRALCDAGHSELVLWVLRSNARARRFYEIAGWRPDGAEEIREVLGAKAEEVRYRMQVRT
jgi:GNAT superfamily N-acetyltransferase